jgi:hypothetical protein
MGSDDDKLLTKADILEGKEKREKVYIDSLGGNVEIKPLTEAEWSRAQAIDQRGTTMNPKVDSNGKITDMNMVIDLEKSTEASSEADRYIVSCGVSNINLTIDDCKRLKPGAVKELVRNILKITGVTLKRISPDKGADDAVKSFRKK